MRELRRAPGFPGVGVTVAAGVEQRRSWGAVADRGGSLAGPESGSSPGVPPVPRWSARGALTVGAGTPCPGDTVPGAW